MSDSPLKTLARVHTSTVHKRRVRVIVSFLAALIPKGSRVLDVGSGDGRVAELLMQARSDLTVEGVDVLVRPDSVIPTRAFDGLSLPFDDDEYDVVMMIDVLHHAQDQQELLGECARVASSCIVLKDHYLQGLGSKLTLRFMDWVGNRAHGVALPYHYLTPREWDALYERFGLTVEEVHTKLHLYPWPWSWLFDRSLHLVARLAVAPSTATANAQS
ncbi:MAG: SAM-dependent methyltransferase [Planctomycetota bacterium]|jgi:SAM-dependent methyltransferase